MTMISEIEKVLDLYGTRDTANVELANSILEGNPQLKAELLSHVEILYGWCKERTYTHTAGKVSPMGTPCDWLFQPKMYINTKLEGKEKFPPYLEFIGIKCLCVGQLPPLPPKTKSFIYEGWGADELPALNDGLEYVDISNSSIKKLPAKLPKSLRALYLYNCRIEELPTLHKGLKRLGLYNNPMVYPEAADLPEGCQFD